MAYNYLGLVNSVCSRVNEVPLTAANFLTADGVYSDIKGYVNASISEINQQRYEWPFNHAKRVQTLSVGVNRYNYPEDAKTVDMDTVRILRDSGLGITGRTLRVISYDEYAKKWIDEESQTEALTFNGLPLVFNDDPFTFSSFGNSSSWGTPSFVFRQASLGFGVYPTPDKEYRIEYEYWRLPQKLINPTDVPSLPFHFERVIVDGGLRGAYLFRGDYEGHDRMQARFEEGIRDMANIYIERIVDVRDTRVTQGGKSGFARTN